MVSVGDLFWFNTVDGRQAGGQVTGQAGDVVSVALCGAVWACTPGVLDLRDEPYALPHLAVPAAQLAAVTVVGTAPVPEALAAAQASWAAGPREVVAAPLAVLMAALVDA